MTWALRDLKANSGIWAGVFIVLVVTQTLLCAMSVGMGVNSIGQDQGSCQESGFGPEPSLPHSHCARMAGDQADLVGINSPTSTGAGPSFGAGSYA